VQFGVVSLFPDMFSVLLQYGVTGRAVVNDLVATSFWNPRDYTHDRHKTVDDRPYGGGPGMVMKVEPLATAIAAAKLSLPKARVAYMSPQGRRFDQRSARELALRDQIIFVAGRYEGIDERLIGHVIDEEWSVGDYVLSGGELAAMAMMDAVIRLLPGVLGDERSSMQDSFTEDGLLDCPHYTRPPVLNGQHVPHVLQGGDHAAIRRWRLKQSLGRTWLRRPDLLSTVVFDKEKKELLDEFIEEHTKP